MCRNAERHVAALAVLICCAVAVASFAGIAGMPVTIDADRGEHGEYCRVHDHGHGHSGSRDDSHDRDGRHDHNSAGGGCAVCAAIKSAAGSRMLFGMASAIARVDFEKSFVAFINIDFVSSQAYSFSPVAAKVRLNN